MVKVLFVCLGNICRSPMAEAVFSEKVKKAGLEDRIKMDSAGTGEWHVGNPPHEGTQDILRKNNIGSEGLKARQVKENDLTEYDYIICMDAENIGNLTRMKGFKDSGEIARLLDFTEDGEDDVPDPYFTGNFDYVYELVEKGCERLLSHICEKEGLER
ncbi:low molecular weight phosphotyrosine protein phosphatase [Bacillus sp. H-16]|uniref:low molecular weight protein-tyrosine-phosphatase n=1 Tax=Alteribacter salitolerans TaxID=2912333 RepID=UPI0019668665|nr:low molecular weight protein-tyrosine-phosphatase [Alteribacter salitolerans]MBM7097226.1 low molecular weight phosphotyrosine protein phosphatase [Alteribacter salitolerans]